MNSILKKAVGIFISIISLTIFQIDAEERSATIEMNNKSILNTKKPKAASKGHNNIKAPDYLESTTEDLVNKKHDPDIHFKKLLLIFPPQVGGFIFFKRADATH